MSHLKVARISCHFVRLSSIKNEKFSMENTSFNRCTLYSLFRSPTKKGFQHKMSLYIDKKLTVAQMLLIDLICQSATGVTIQL